MAHYLIAQWRALALFTALLTITAPSQAVDSDLYLAGLGLHQETGRNIYLGGIYLEREGERPDDLTEASGTRIMEYRVIARRTSIRSLLGGMLLQSEVATGQPPNKATADFADALLSTVSTSLYAGDSLQIHLTDSETIAMLNGHELVRAGNAEVGNYLLMGWVGKSGPSTVFRNKITAGEVDPSLLSALEANTYSADREAEIARWVEPEPAAAAPEPVIVAVASPTVAAQIHAEAQPGATVQTEEETPGEIAPEVAAVVQNNSAEEALEITTEVVKMPDAGAPIKAAQAAEGEVQLASLTPVPGVISVPTLEEEIRALDVQEYSQRLATFHSDVIRMVYGQIRYPKRAVRRSLEGRVELDITMTEDGKILEIAMAQPSGHLLLDDAAMSAAQDAFENGLDEVDPVALAEFGDFDSGVLTIPIPVSFRLQ